MVHDETPAAAFTPVPPMAKLPVLAVAVMVGVPPHELTTPGVPAMTRPAGKASVKVMPVCANAPATLLMVKVSVVV